MQTLPDKNDPATLILGEDIFYWTSYENSCISNITEDFN